MQQIRGVGPTLVSLLLFLTAVECLLQPQDTSGSGSGRAELWIPGEGERCGVPPYAPQPLSSTEEDTFAKLRCHLACIGRKNTTLGLDAIREWKNTTVWPYYVMNVTKRKHCAPYRNIHECERGCFLWSKFPGLKLKECKKTCHSECQEEKKEVYYVPCNHYSKCVKFCSLNCDKKICEDGCKLYVKRSNGTRPPMNPVAPPELSIVENSSAAGVYNINLTQAMPDNSNITTRSEDGPTGVIFRLQDLQSGNVTYIQLVNPEEPLILTAYACKELSVSFSVANGHSLSDYSPTLNITVYGDLRKIPNPVTNLRVTQEDDQRLGFFGRAILNVTWSHPDNMQYLDSYKVEVMPTSNASVCVSDTYMSGLLPPETTSYTVKAKNSSDLPVLTCSYRIKVYSVGKDYRTETTSPYSVSRFDPTCIQFMCSRLWDSYQYFSFNTTWILPPHVVFGNTISSFRLQTRLINTEVGATTPVDFGSETLRIQEVNKTTYTYMLIGSDEPDRQFVSRQNVHFKYKIDMTIDWNESNLIYVPGSYSYGCTIEATAPNPSVVRNLTVHSYRFTAGQNEIELGFSWDPPAVVNGRQVERYQVSIGPYALRPHEETPQSNSLTADYKGNCTSTIWKTPYIASSDTHCLYFQMRAHNEFVAGNWTEPYIVPRNINAAVQLECSSGWSSQHGNLTVNISWSVLLPCTGAERPVLWFTLHPLVVNTSSEETAPIEGYNSSLGVIHVDTAEEGHGNYSYTFGNLQLQEDLSHRYKFVLQPEWDERILGGNFSCMVDAVSVSCDDPGTPANAQREGDRFLYGDQVVFTCNNGYYQSSGPEGGVRTCMESGLWSETQPTCAFTKQQSHVSWLAVLSLLGVVLVVVVATMICHKFRKRKRQLERISKEPCHDPMFSSGPKRLRRINNTTILTTDEWELPPSHVIIEDCLGEGAFGEVYRGIIRGPIMNPKVHPSMKSAICTTVAIKLLKLSAKGSERRDFLQEIEMMKKVSEGQNPHVVTLIGCVTIQEPLCLITEYVKYGDLLTYLRTNRQLYSKDGGEDVENLYLEVGNVSPLDLISFAYQIASGMEYLSSLGIVHRDLACRNVLIGEGKALKITDFGMSRETEEVYVQKTKGRVPLKWMAVESIISREFTTASDVWAYGVVLWEIGTLGGFPYPSIQNEDLLSLLKRGYRMEKPDNCSSDVYDIMLECWNEEPRKRPTFSQLRASFDALLLAERKDAYIVLQVDTEKPYYKETSDSKEFLHIAPLSAKRKSQLSVDVPVYDIEKPASSHASTSPQSSPWPSNNFHGHRSPLSLSPCHEHSPQPPRPASMHLLRSDQQQQQPVVNPYVDEPSRPRTKLMVPMNPTQDMLRRRRSDGNIQLSGDAHSSAPPSIQITVSPGPE